MRDARILLLVAAFACAALAAACSLRSPLFSPLPASGIRSAARVGAPQPEASSFGSWLYSCSPKGNDCPIYTVSGTKLTYVKTLSGLAKAEGGFATTSGKWYQAIWGASKINVYKSNATGPTGPNSTLADPGQNPLDVAVNTAHNLVAVSNEETTSGGPGSVSVYSGGAKSPTATLSYSISGGSVLGVGIVTDVAGDCFWGIFDSTHGAAYVIKFAGCAGTGTVAVSGIAFVGGLAMDKAGDLFYTDQSKGAVYKCKLLKSCAVLASGFTDPAVIQFDAGWTHLWLMDFTTAKIYALNPATGAVLSTTAEHGGVASAVAGIAFAPGTAH